MTPKQPLLGYHQVAGARKSDAGLFTSGPRDLAEFSRTLLVAADEVIE
jgi:hypothetical protein